MDGLLQHIALVPAIRHPNICQGIRFTLAASQTDDMTSLALLLPGRRSESAVKCRAVEARSRDTARSLA